MCLDNNVVLYCLICVPASLVKDSYSSWFFFFFFFSVVAAFCYEL